MSADLKEPEAPVAAPPPPRIDPAQLIDTLRTLRHAKHDDAYWQRLCACLSLLCRARAAVVLRAAQEGGAWRLLGTNAAPDSALVTGASARLAELAPRALAQGHAYAPQADGQITVAVRLLGPSGPTLALLEVPGRERTAINEILVRAQLVADLPASMPAPSPTPQAPGTAAGAQAGAGRDAPAQPGLLELLDLVARVMQESDFGAATLSLVNSVAAVLGCEQVVLGWYEDGEAHVQAISHIDRFERKADNVQLIESALEEAVDQHVDILYPVPAGSSTVTLAHERLSRQTGFNRLATLVCRDGAAERDSPLALTLARREGGFDKEQLHQVVVALHLLKPWLTVLRGHSKWWGARWHAHLRRRLLAWLSPEHPGRKLMVVAGVAALGVICFGTWPYRIEAPGELTTDSVQVLSAPFDGFLRQVQGNLGDTVNQGTVLAQLDTRELSLQASDLQSEMRRYEAEADRARALAQTAETQIALARATQAQARMERVQFQLQQAQIAAPFTGVLVEGERKELSGSPVRQGDKLFRLARIEGLYAVIHVSERDVRELPPQARGRLRLLSQPDHDIGFRVEKLVPLAQAKGGQGGQFTLKVLLDESAAAWWRPGMTGLALIETGERRIIWIWTHKLLDMLHMTFWW